MNNLSQIGWIDFSPSDRQKVGTILDLIKPEGMVDELGIGIIRDAIANQLFPGISTIQTRAKYFFIVPYILFDYLALSSQQRRNNSSSAYLDKTEHEIMWFLGEKYNYEEGNGVIGIRRRRPQRIMRRPSDIYWYGISLYNLIDSGGLGFNSFLKLRSSNEFESLLSDTKFNEDSTGDDADADFDNRFRIKIPPPEPGWKDNLDLDLSETEADILYSRITEIQPNKLISEILKKDQIFALLTTSKNFHEFARAAVELPSLSDSVKDTLILAHDFSEMIYGTHIIYNILLQEAKYRKEYFTGEWDEWLTGLKDTMLDYDNFTCERLFAPPFAPHSRGYTNRFIVDFTNYIMNGGKETGKIKELIINQEYKNKKHKARLYLKKFDDVSEEKWLGFTRLDYRYGNAKVILEDIKKGCER